MEEAQPIAGQQQKFQVLNLLAKLYASETAPKERKKAEKDLAAYGNNIIEHTSSIIEIITTKDIPSENIIKLQASAYLHGYIRNILKERAVENSELHYVSEEIIKVVLNQAVVNGVKQQLIISLENLLYIDSQRGEDGGALVKKYADICYQALINLRSMADSQPVVQQEQYDINGLLLVISTLFKEASDGEVIMLMFKALGQPLATLVSTITIQVLQQLLERASGQQIAHTPRSEYPQIDTMTVEQKLYLVRTWAAIHLDMLKKFKQIKVKGALKGFVQQDEYGRLFQSILKFVVPPMTPQAQMDMMASSQLDPEGTLISQCGIVEIDLLMNEIKAKVLNSMKIVWQFLFNKKPKEVYASTNVYYMAAALFCPKIMNTLIYLGGLQNNAQVDFGGPTLETMCQNGHVNQIVRSGIDVLCILARQNTEPFFQTFFTGNSFKMYLQIVLPYLKLTEKEKEDMDSDHKEFVNYSIDICQKQKSRTFKSQAAKLLESLIDHVDGMLTFTVNFNLEILQSILTGSSQVQVKETLAKFNLVFTSDEELMDVCLLSTSVMSYAVVKRDDLLQVLDKLMIEHLDKFINAGTTILIRNRFCLFLGFFLDMLFTTVKRTAREDALEKILYFLFESLALTKKQKVVSIQALDVLSTQISDEMLTVKIQHHFDWIIERLSDYNVNLNLQSYFDFLGDFIKKHYSNFTQDNLVMFMRSLVQRIQKELAEQTKAITEGKGGKTLSTKAPKRKAVVNSKANIRINKCWNTIRFIAEHDYFADQYLSIVEETLLPLFEYLVTPTQIDFDDDIIFCLCSMMKKSKQVSPVLRKIFPFLPKFQSKYKGIFGNLLQAINYYIVYGREFLQESQENLGLLFEMANASMFKKDPPIILGNNMEGALLLHMVFQNLEGPILRQIIGDILTNVVSRIKDQPMSPTFRRTLLEVIYSAMLFDVNLTLEFLAHASFLEEFFKMAFDNWRQLKLSYERKLFALAMTNFLFNSAIPRILQDKAPYFLRELVSLLIRQQRIEQKLIQLSSSKKARQAASTDNGGKNGSLVNPVIDQMLLEQVNEIMEEYSSDEQVSPMKDQEEEKMMANTDAISTQHSSMPAQIFQIVKEGDAATEMEVQRDIEEEEKLVVDSDFKQEEYDLNFNVSQMITRITEWDEFDYFSTNFRRLHSQQSEQLNQIIATSFTAKHRDYLKTILASKRVLIIANPMVATAAPKKKADSDNNIEAMQDETASDVENTGHIRRDHPLFQDYDAAPKSVVSMANSHIVATSSARQQYYATQGGAASAIEDVRKVIKVKRRMPPQTQGSDLGLSTIGPTEAPPLDQQPDQQM